MKPWRRWFGNDANFNVAIAVPAGVVVVDVDPTETDPLEELLGDLDLPSGPIVATPRGGRHHYLRLPKAGSYKQRSLRAGVDIRLPGRGYCPGEVP